MNVEAKIVSGVVDWVFNQLWSTGHRDFYLVTISFPREMHRHLTTNERLLVSSDCARVHTSMRHRGEKLHRFWQRQLLSKTDGSPNAQMPMLLAIDDPIIEGGGRDPKMNGPHLHMVVGMPERITTPFEELNTQIKKAEPDVPGAPGFLRLTEEKGTRRPDIDVRPIDQTEDDLRRVIRYSLKYALRMDHHHNLYKVYTDHSLRVAVGARGVPTPGVQENMTLPASREPNSLPQRKGHQGSFPIRHLWSSQCPMLP